MKLSDPAGAVHRPKSSYTTADTTQIELEPWFLVRTRVEIQSQSHTVRCVQRHNAAAKTLCRPK